MLQLIDQYNPDHNHRDQFGRTPLHLACRAGSEPAVGYIVSQGKADINARSIGGETPLIKACESGNVNIVNFLLEKGADPFITDN